MEKQNWKQTLKNLIFVKLLVRLKMVYSIFTNNHISLMTIDNCYKQTPQSSFFWVGFQDSRVSELFAHSIVSLDRKIKDDVYSNQLNKEINELLGEIKK